jgi:hypothetical protein
MAPSLRPLTIVSHVGAVRLRSLSKMPRVNVRSDGRVFYALVPKRKILAYLSERDDARLSPLQFRLNRMK